MRIPALAATPILLCACLVLVACGGGSSTSPSGTSTAQLQSADVRVDGVSVTAKTIAAGSGQTTLFMATLADPTQRVHVRQMMLDYPQHNMGMMGGTLTVNLYDDGTHGDQTANDGTYCYLDVNEHIGPHLADCPHGVYSYRFHGQDDQGMTTNTLQCQVTVQ